MKRLFLIVAVLALAASLGAQSLVELARREKARRESLKGRSAVVVRNADLLRVKKTPAVEVIVPEPETGDEVAEGVDAGLEAAPGEEASTNLPSGSGAPSSRRIVPQVAPAGPVIANSADRDQVEGIGPLEAQLKAANELVDLLSTKMAALRQQYEAQDAMVPGSVIQQQLDETNQRLVKAQAQQARIEAQVAKGAGAKKTSVPALR
jgi:hypothetical protein